MRYTIEDLTGHVILATTSYQYSTQEYILRDIQPVVDVGLIEDGEYIVNVYNNWDDPVATLDLHVEDRKLRWRF